MMNRKTLQATKRAAILVAQNVTEGSAANDLHLNTTDTFMSAPRSLRPVTEYRVRITRKHPS